MVLVALNEHGNSHHEEPRGCREEKDKKKDTPVRRRMYLSLGRFLGSRFSASKTRKHRSSLFFAEAAKRFKRGAFFSKFPSSWNSRTYRTAVYGTP